MSVGSIRHPFSIGAFLLGCSVGMSFVATTRVSLWRRNSSVLDAYPTLVSSSTSSREDGDLFFGPEVRSYMVHLWNQGVIDGVAKPVIHFLADRQW